MIRFALPALLFSIILTACGTDEKPPETTVTVLPAPVDSVALNSTIKKDTVVTLPTAPTQMFTPPVIVDEEVSEPPPSAEEYALKVSRNTGTQEGEGETEIVTSPVTVSPDTENDVLIIVDQMPEFPGGRKAMMQFLSENLQYPQTAIEGDIQGKVYVSFTVRKDGRVDDVKVLRGIGSGCDEEAIRVVKKMPKWLPGLTNGKPVNVKYNLPVVFQLQ